MSLDLIDFVKNKKIVEIDFSKAQLENSFLRRILGFYINSLPEEQKESFQQSLRSAIQSRSVIELDFSKLPLPDYLGKGSDLLKQQLGVPVLPTRSEVETRLKQIEQARKQRALKPSEIEEKERLEYIKEQVLPVEELGLGQIQKILETTRNKLVENLTQELQQLDKDILQTRSDIEVLRGRLEKVPPFSADAVKYANMLKQAQDKLVSNVATRRKINLYVKHLQNKDKWYEDLWVGFIDGFFREAQAPFIRGIISMEEKDKARQVVEKLKLGKELTESEQALLRELETRHLTSQSLAYNIGYGLAGMPAWSAEMLILGKLLALLGVSKAIVSLITRYLGVKAKAPKKLLEFLTFGAIQGAANVPYIASEMFDRMLDEYVVVPHGDKLITILNRQGDDFWTALSKSFGSSVVEHASEFMGSFIQGWRKFLPKWVLTRFVQKKGIKKVDDIMQLIKKGMRWNGILGEVFEEEIARLGHAVLEGGYTPPWTDEGLRILFQEFVTIGAWGGLLSLPDMPSRIRETAQKIQEYRRQFRPPLITDEEVERIRKQKKAPKEASISPEVQQVIDEALVTPPPPPSEERVVFTAPPKVKIKNDLFKDVATIESLQEIYRKSFDNLEQERNRIKTTYDEFIQTLKEEITEQAKLVDYDPKVLKEQLNAVVKDITKERDRLLEKTQQKELSYIASYQKRLQELQELQELEKAKQPKITPIQIWQNTLPVPVEPIITEQEIERLKNISKKTEEILNTELPKIDDIQKQKIITSLYDFKIALIPFENIKIRPEIQEQLRPYLRYDLGLVDAIAKYFDITFYDLLKIAYIESIGENVLFDGHHRYGALAKLHSANKLQDIFPQGIPVVIFNFKNLDELMAKITLLRMINEARHGLNIVEQAKAYQDLLNSGYKVEDIASMLGRKIGDIEDILLVNKLSQEWKQLAINKEQLPKKLQKISTDKLVITMANIVDKYNIPEVVQNEILDIVKEEGISASILEDWLENILGNVETLVKKENKDILFLFSPEEFKRLKSAFKDILLEYKKLREKLAGTLTSYKKVVADLEKRVEQGEEVPQGTLEHHKKIIKEFENKIKELQKYILETYKNRPLTQEELQELEKIKVYFKEPTKNFFEFIDEKYGELREYSLFPDERPTNLGFRMVNDMRQIPTLLTLEVVEDRVVAKKTIISPPVAGYDYFLIINPDEQILFGVEKQGRTEIENASLLLKFLGFDSVLAKDIAKKTHLLLVKIADKKISLDTKYIDGKKISQKDQKLIEKAMRTYFQPHIPIQWGINKSDTSEQLWLFREIDDFYEAPIQTAVEENISLVLPGGFLTLRKPVDFSLENIKKIFKYAGISLITPHHEIAVVLGLKNNKIVSLEVLSSIQKIHGVSFDLAFYEKYKDVDKILFLHRHPTPFIDEIVRWIYDANIEARISKQLEILPKEEYDNLMSEFRKLFATIKDVIKQLPEGIQTKYSDFEKVLREKLTEEQIEALYKFFLKYHFLPSTEDISLLEKYKKILQDKVSDVIYIFNDVITEINIKTWQTRSIPYEKTFLEKVERIKSMFEDIPFWWHWNYYRKIGIEFDIKIAYALFDVLKKHVGWAIFTKEGKIVRITHLPSMFEVFQNKKDVVLSAYTFDFDTVHIFAPKGYVDEHLQDFKNLRNDAEVFGVNFLLHTIQQDNITIELTHFTEPEPKKINRVYLNILKKYGKNFSENELKRLFEQRFGYPFSEIDKEDGAEFRSFLDKLLLTPDKEKGKIIEQWINKEIDFLKIKQKIKSYTKKSDRPTLLRQLRLYASREPEIFDKVVKIVAGDVKDFKALDTETIRKIVNYIALVEADENLRKTVEFLSPDDIELSISEKLKYGLTDFNIVDATFLRLSKRYPVMREIRDSVLKYLMEKDRIRGRCYVQISEIERVLGRDFIKTKFDTFVDYIETGVLSDRLTDEEKEKVKKAYNLYKNMMDYIFMLASDAGVIMYDPIRGLFVPIQYRENYFPHFYEKDYLDNLIRNEKLLEEIAKANKISVESVKLMLELQREDLKSRTFANIEMHRLFNIPGYKKTFDVLIEYVRRASDRIAWVREFGNDVFIAPGRGYMPIKLYTMISKIDNKEVRDYVKHVFSVLLYKHYLSYEASNSIFRALRKLQVPKLMTAWIENLWQWFINFSPKVPYTQVMDAIIKRLTTLGYGREILEFYGLSEQLGRALVQMYGEEKDDVFDKIASMTLSLGFVQTERNNRVMVALLGKEYTDYLRKLLKKGKVEKVRYELETLGVTQDLIRKIVKQKDITQEDEFEIIWTANSMTNYLVDLWFMPFIMSKSELFRTIFQFFGTFYIPQTRMITRMYIKPFFEYIRSGGKRGNVSGFAKMMLHVVIASILARAVRDFIGRRKLLLPKEDWDRVANILFFILLSGWFGLYAIPIEFILYGADAIKDRFIGVGFNHFLTTLDELFKLNFPKVIEIQTPMLRYFMNWATKRITYYTPPTYNLHYNLVRNLQRSYEYSQKTLGTQHFFTQFLYKLYLQQRANFLKKYGGIYTKLKGQTLPFRTLTPSRAEIISRTEGL